MGRRRLFSSQQSTPIVRHFWMVALLALCKQVGFDTSQPAASALLDAWLDCALHLQCIAPVGSHRGNHRQDQAALSLLVRLSREGQALQGGGGFTCSELSKLPVGPNGAVGVANDKLVRSAHR